MPIHSGMGDEDMRETIDRTIECYHKMAKFLNQPDMPKPVKEQNAKLLERAKL